MDGSTGGFDHDEHTMAAQKTMMQIAQEMQSIKRKAVWGSLMALLLSAIIIGSLIPWRMEISEATVVNPIFDNNNNIFSTLMKVDGEETPVVVPMDDWPKLVPGTKCNVWRRVGFLGISFSNWKYQESKK